MAQTVHFPVSKILSGMYQTFKRSQNPEARTHPIGRQGTLVQIGLRSIRISHLNCLASSAPFTHSEAMMGALQKFRNVSGDHDHVPSRDGL